MPVNYPKSPPWQDNVDPLDAATFNDVEARGAAFVNQQVAVETARAQAAEMTQWASGQNYVPTQQVMYLGQAYACQTSHTSSANFSSDLAQGFWALVGSGAGGGGGGGGDTHVVSALGSVGATSAITMGPTTDKWVTLTLTVDHTATVTPSSGGRLRYFILQDATGGHTFTLSDGTNTQAVDIATAASSPTMVSVFSPDGVDLWLGGS